jgi:hypothetical protein
LEKKFKGISDEILTKRKSRGTTPLVASNDGMHGRVLT